jgi:hypothetical protein
LGQLAKKGHNCLTIKYPVVNIARELMILMGANPFRGQLEIVGPENRYFFGPEMATSEARAIWTQNVELFMAHPFQCPGYGFAFIRIIKTKRHIKRIGHW